MDLLKTKDGKKIPRTGTAIVYDNNGQYIYFTKYELQAEDEVISKESMINFLRNVIRDARRSNGDLDAIVIHRDGEIFNEEISAINEISKTEDFSIIIEAFPKKSFPIIELSNNNQPTYAEPGIYFYAGKQLIRNNELYDTFFMQTFSFPGPKGRKVNMLKYRFISAKNISNRERDDILKDIARQNFYLSRLNWSTALGTAKSPVTVHYAHKASKLLSSGLQPQFLREDKLYMI